MKKDEFKKVDIKKRENEFIITCPVCGYSFRNIYPKREGFKEKSCPMCGFKFKNKPNFKF